MSARLTAAALRRATLDRQLLLARSPLGPVEAVRRLAGPNAQHSLSPYISLWSRLSGFRAEALERAVAQGSVLKATLMRGTLHLEAAQDYPALWQALASARRRTFASFFPKEAKALDGDRLVALVEERLRAAPAPYRDLEAILAPHFPGLRPTSLSFAAKCLAPIVQLPPSGMRSYAGPQTYGWVGAGDAEEGADADLAALLRRYLRAFGPATARDLQQWSGLPMAAARLAVAAVPDLVRLEGPEGGEYLDLPDLPLPPEDASAPVRLLPRWDNVLLAYRDRSRMMRAEDRPKVIQRDGRVLPTFLLGGLVEGLWDAQERSGSATLTLVPFRPIAPRDAEALEEEALRLSRWLFWEARGHSVRLAEPL